MILNDIDDIKPFLSAELRKLRAEKDITQTELAEKVGINKATINKYEKGKYDMSMNVIQKIIRFYGIDFYIFFNNIYENIRRNKEV